MNNKERRELALNIRTKLSKNQQHPEYYKPLSDDEVSYIQDLITKDLVNNKMGSKSVNAEDLRTDTAMVYGYLKRHSGFNKETICLYLSKNANKAIEDGETKAIKKDEIIRLDELMERINVPESICVSMPDLKPFGKVKGAYKFVYLRDLMGQEDLKEYFDLLD